jgi:hypothetical protein
MKHALIFALIFAFAFGAIQTFAAQTAERQTVKINKQKKFARSKVTVKFVSLVEDSRCPEGTNCVWAGNAKIKIEVASGGRKETFEVNTTIGPKGAAFDGYAINLIDLKPTPKANVKINRNSYTATFEVTRLTR